LDISPKNLKFAVSNHGLGPAEIRDVAFPFNAKCYSSEIMDPNEWVDGFISYVRVFWTQIYARALPPMPWIPNGKKKFDIEDDP
jgi:hypothetical protein